MSDKAAIENDEYADVVAQARQLLSDYHFALDLRQHGGAAAQNVVHRLETLLDMFYEQGKEQRERAGKKPHARAAG